MAHLDGDVVMWWCGDVVTWWRGDVILVISISPNSRPDFGNAPDQSRPNPINQDWAQSIGIGPIKPNWARSGAQFWRCSQFLQCSRFLRCSQDAPNFGDAPNFCNAPDFCDAPKMLPRCSQFWRWPLEIRELTFPPKNAENATFGFFSECPCGQNRLYQSHEWM
jgi:hypothetical protein